MSRTCLFTKLCSRCKMQFENWSSKGFHKAVNLCRSLNCTDLFTKLCSRCKMQFEDWSSKCFPYQARSLYSSEICMDKVLTSTCRSRVSSLQTFSAEVQQCHEAPLMQAANAASSLVVQKENPSDDDVQAMHIHSMQRDTSTNVRCLKWLCSAAVPTHERQSTRCNGHNRQR